MKKIKIDGVSVSEYLRHYEQYRREVERLCYLYPSSKSVYVLHPEVYIQRLAEIEALSAENTRLQRLEAAYVMKCEELMAAYDKLNWLRKYCAEHKIPLPFKI